METPVALIQSLYERQRCIQTQLEALVELRQAESHLQEELTQIAALLACYPSAEPEVPFLQGDAVADLSPVTVVSVAREEEALAAAPAHDASRERTDASPLPVALTQLLQDVGPGNVAYLQRQLRQLYGRDVPSATLYDALKRGQAAKLYAYTNKQWRLRSRTSAVAGNA